MASWKEITEAEPDFAERVRALFDAHTHKTLATLRRDGAPRISGTEASFSHGEVWFGGMYRGVKSLDLLRDPRFALHSGSGDPPEWKGDAKLAGRAVEITDPERIATVTGGQSGPMHLFRADITEVVITRVGEPRDHLVIEAWHEGRGLERRKRY
jgi:hypothetical protein